MDSEVKLDVTFILMLTGPSASGSSIVVKQTNSIRPVPGRRRFGFPSRRDAFLELRVLRRHVAIGRLDGLRHSAGKFPHFTWLLNVNELVQKIESLEFASFFK
jgi:hypothetical protein